MRYRALRGVCVGVGQHLSAGDTIDLEPAQAVFLVHIKAIELIPDETPITGGDEVAAEKKPNSAPVKPGKKEKSNAQ
jgi:hypothetical protein